MDDFEKEIKIEFLAEASYLLEEAENVFLEFEKNSSDPHLIDNIFRLAHNLKGTSKAVGFQQISELTHVVENLILKVKNGELQASSKTISVLLEFKDTVTHMVSALKNDLDATFEFSELINSINDEIEGKVNKVEEVAVAKPEMSKDEEPVEEVPFFEEEVQTPNFEINEELLKEAEFLAEGISSQKPETSEKVEPLFSAEPEKTKVEPKVDMKKDEDSDIRVKLSRINRVNNYIGELVILQTVLDQKRATGIEDQLISHSIGQMSKIFKELQELAMSLRMLPLKNTIHKLRRIVRDTSSELNKEIELHVIGENTEVDKKVTEYISDPLVHIVRNGLDHGIETPEERVANGKERVGNLEIMAFHEGSNIVIQVTDDGKGIDPNIIRKKAIEKGIINSNSPMDDKEVIQLIFHPGFSTKDVVSDVSGRGVGMDVVKTNIEKLGGKVKVMSKIGEGSSFRIELPLTMAIIEGLVIESNNLKYAIQLNQVQEIVKLSKEKITKVEKAGQYIQLRGDVIPYFDLNTYLGGVESDAQNLTMLILKDSNKRYAVRIDEVVSKQQVVVKQLGQEYASRLGFAGGTILGDGHPAFILDLIELFRGVFTMRASNIRQEGAA